MNPLPDAARWRLLDEALRELLALDVTQRGAL